MVELEGVVNVHRNGSFRNQTGEAQGTCQLCYILLRKYKNGYVFCSLREVKVA